MGAKAQNARNYIFNLPLKRDKVDTPFWPDLDGSVYMQDVPGDEIKAIQDASSGDTSKDSAAMICKSLVILEDDGTYSNVFVYPDDIGQVAHLGASLLMPVFNKVNEFFGFVPSAVTVAKNDSEPMLNNNTGIGSVREAVIVP